jgi:hypothetical protein
MNDIDKILISLKYYSAPENWQELAEKHFAIEDAITHEKKPFTFTPIQKKTFDNLIKQLKEKGSVNALIIKSRRAQLSSIIGFLSCCVALFYPDSINLVVAIFKENAKSLLNERYKSLLKSEFVKEYLSLMYNLPKEKTITFAEESIKLCNGSIIKVASMEGGTDKDNISIGAGIAIRFLHITEYFGQYSSVEKTFDAIKGLNTWNIRESTPRPAVAIHEDYQKCISNPYSETQVMFFPWWEDPFNVKKQENYQPSKEVLQYAKDFNPNLTSEQLCFLDSKLAGKNLKSFNEEYPATPELAFFQSTNELFFSQNLIYKCVMRYNTLLPDVSGYPIVMGIDPAYTGKDNCVICIRQGQVVLQLLSFKPKDFESSPTNFIVSSVLNAINQIEKKTGQKVIKIFIDRTGSQSLVDMLKDILGRQKVIGVAFGEKALNEANFLNKGAEMMSLVKDSMEQETNFLFIPEDKNLIKQMSNLRFEYCPRTSKLKREEKDRLKERIGMSPDELDALALTFAYPVKYFETQNIKNFDFNNFYSYQEDKELDFRNILK